MTEHSADVVGTSADRVQIGLNGVWQFRMDPQDIGVQQGWHSAAVPFQSNITVPGSWQAQGFGEPEGILRHSYEGTAWYRKTVAVPAAWQGKAIRLNVAGSHRRSSAFVNGQPVGAHDSFYA